jgi:hypothetical protein
MDAECHVQCHDAPGHWIHAVLTTLRLQVTDNIRAARKKYTLKYNYDDYVSELRRRMQLAREIERKILVESKRRSKTNYDHETEGARLKVEDKVLFTTEVFGEEGPRYLEHSG